MLTKYKVKELPEITHVVAASNLDKLTDNGFLVFQMDSLNPEAINDLVEALGLNEFPFPCIVVDANTKIYEVIQGIEDDKDRRIKELEETVEDLKAQLEM